MRKLLLLLLISMSYLGNTLMAKDLNIGILVYEGVYLLDFAGPLEVFNDASIIDTTANINVYTFSPDGLECKAHTGLKIHPQYSLQNCPKPDVIVIPGGDLNISIDNQNLKNWLLKSVPECKLTLSVCTGAFILAKIGLLDERVATTWHGARKALKKVSEKIQVKDTRITDNGDLITTAGISAGIDGSLYTLSKLFSKDLANKTAQYMDYDYWSDDVKVEKK